MEMISQNGFQSIVQKCARYVAQPFTGTLKYVLLQSKYKRHAFEKAFDWQWEKTHYNRIALVNLLISKKHDPAYLEIGCASNSLFDSVPCNRKIGVDPVAGGNIRRTSDDFFGSNTQLFDIVFIDGLHTYEQVRRDVINSVNFLKPGGYIAMHDMLPGSWVEHHVPRISGDWTGDVWKVAFEISQSKAIDFKIVKIDHGVGVLRLTDERANLADHRGELKEKEFEYFYTNIAKLPIIEWQEFVDWLG
jgi:hypothetical protein